MEILRIWRDGIGWVHEAREGNNIFFASRSRDEVIEAYPDAARNGRVICGTEEYICAAERA